MSSQTLLRKWIEHPTKENWPKFVDLINETEIDDLRSLLSYAYGYYEVEDGLHDEKHI